MSISHMTVESASIFGGRKFIATLHIMGKRISTIMGDCEPTVDELATTERRLRERVGHQRSNYVPARADMP